MARITVAELCADLAAEHQALDELVAPLSDQSWLTMTPADGWDVRDQIGHLCYFDEQARLALTDPAAFDATRAARTAGVAPGAGPGPAVTPDIALARALPGPALLARWRDSGESLLAVIPRADPAARVPWYGPAMSVASFVTARVMETWAHGQDVADALSAPPVVSDRLRHVCHIGIGARPYAFAVHGRPDPTDPIRFEVTAPSGALWTWGPVEAADRIRGGALDLALVVTQRRHPDDTNLEVRGPVAAQWVSVAQAFAGGPGSGRPARTAGVIQEPG